MIESSPRPFPPRRALVFTGQPNITDEIDRLITCFVEEHHINVHVTSGGETLWGRLEKCPHQSRINIRHEDSSLSVATIAFMTRLEHDFTPEKHSTLLPSAALA